MIHARKLRKHASQISRFLLVGGLNALATYGIFLAYLWGFGIYYLLANVLAFITWSWFGYELQRRFVFVSPGNSGVFVRYIANQVAFMAIGTGVLALLVGLAGIPPAIAYLVMLTIVTAGLYVTSKFLVFPHSRRSH
jgi:putative flippase GtrA